MRFSLPTGGIYFRNFDPTVSAGTEVEVEGFSAQGRSLQIIVGQERRPCKWFKTKLKDRRQTPQTNYLTFGSVDDEKQLANF
jgi:hypothetical protein